MFIWTYPLGLFCEKQRSGLHPFAVTPLKATTTGTWELFEFPLMRALTHWLQGSASQGMTHSFEKAGQVRSSAQGQAQKDAR